MKAPLTIGMVCCIAQCFAQPSQPAFEAATVKPSKAETGSSSWHSRVGYLTMRNLTLKGLVEAAYHLKEGQVSGGPKWLTSDRFDIEARAAGPAKDPELMAMLRTLLAERFQLVSHRDTKLFDGFAMVLAKAGGLKIPPDNSPGGDGSNGRRGSLEVKHMTMARLAESLSRILGAPVVDTTNTPGAYSFKLEWSPESMQRTASPDGPPPDAVLGPSLFTVLQQQLGLKLESKKTPAEILVIDKAEKPSDN